MLFFVDLQSKASLIKHNNADYNCCISFKQVKLLNYGLLTGLQVKELIDKISKLRFGFKYKFGRFFWLLFSSLGCCEDALNLVRLLDYVTSSAFIYQFFCILRNTGNFKKKIKSNVFNF